MQSDPDQVCVSRIVVPRVRVPRTSVSRIGVPRIVRAAPDHARVARRLIAGRMLRVRRSSINAQPTAPQR